MTSKNKESKNIYQYFIKLVELEKDTKIIKYNL